VYFLVVPASIMLAVPTPEEPAPPPACYKLSVGEVTLHHYRIEGPVDYKGIRATRIRAERAEIRDPLMEGVLGLSSGGLVLENFEAYVTYVRGTGSAFGMRVRSGWLGSESPPWLLGLLGDPATLSDVTMHVIRMRGDLRAEGLVMA